MVTWFCFCVRCTSAGRFLKQSSAVKPLTAIDSFAPPANRTAPLLLLLFTCYEYHFSISIYALPFAFATPFKLKICCGFKCFHVEIFIFRFCATFRLNGDDDYAANEMPTFWMRWLVLQVTLGKYHRIIRFGWGEVCWGAVNPRNPTKSLWREAAQSLIRLIPVNNHWQREINLNRYAGRHSTWIESIIPYSPWCWLRRKGNVDFNR